MHTQITPPVLGQVGMGTTAVQTTQIHNWRSKDPNLPKMGGQYTRKTSSASIDPQCPSNAMVRGGQMSLRACIGLHEHGDRASHHLPTLGPHQIGEVSLCDVKEVFRLRHLGEKTLRI